MKMKKTWYMLAAAMVAVAATFVAVPSVAQQAGGYGFRVPKNGQGHHRLDRCPECVCLVGISNPWQQPPNSSHRSGAHMMGLPNCPVLYHWCPDPADVEQYLGILHMDPACSVPTS
jgi:hypothetical protein